MSQILLTEAERIKGLEQFGYTETEARFLLLAVLHGGYFLRRQYGEFLGREDGGSITQLVQKTLGCGHAKATTWRQNTQLYHLCARPFYEAIGQGDNRNRRMRERNAIKAKIMALDFVLTRRDRQYLATDQEKFDYFIRVLRLDADCLPFIQYRGKRSNEMTTRYFIEKFPIYVTEMAGAPTVVTFAFIDEGLAGLSAFESFLERYGRLFEALKDFEVAYIAATPTHFEPAKRCFERFRSGGSLQISAAPIQPELLPRLLEFFELRRAYAAGEYASFDRPKLMALRDGREAFSGKEYDALFKTWELGGMAVLRQVLARREGGSTWIGGRFSTCLLQHDYSLFNIVAAA